MTPQENIRIPLSLANELRGALSNALELAKDSAAYGEIVRVREKLDERLAEKSALKTANNDTMRLRRKLLNVRAEVEQVLNELG